MSYSKIELEYIDRLCNDIKRYATEYYTGQPTITDHQFDLLVDQLRLVNPENKLLSTVGWGYIPIMNKESHDYRNVGSLSKYRDYLLLNSDLGTISERVIMPKYDGISCVAYYRNGKLYKAVTRGNGVEGTNITDKFRYITGVNELTDKLSSYTAVAIRGELIISDSKFLELKKITPQYKNSRNAVAGIINSGEFSEGLNYIDFVPYKLQGCNGDDVINKLSSALYELYKVFPNATKYVTVDSGKLVTNSELDFAYGLRGDYPCDGVVISNNEFNYDNDGSVDITQYAYKFEDEKAESRVDHLEWNLTRTGRYVPKAIIDPVDLDGATIQRVTCFNAKYVMENRLGPDAYVEIQRSGMVIPDIQKVTVECPNFELPTKCPACGADLVWDGVDLVCSNSDCSSKNFEKLFKWVWELGGCGDIDGVGGSLVSKFIEIHTRTSNNINALMKSVTRMVIGCISHKDIEDLGDATASKFDQIARNLTNPVDPRKFLIALNIPKLGWTTACKIVESDVFSMLTAGYTNEDEEVPCYDTSEIKEELMRIPGVGWNVSEVILSNIDRIESLAKLVEFKCIEKPEKTPVRDPRYFCVTGSLEYGTRDQFCKYMEQFGWYQNDIKKSEFLVTNSKSTSSKYKKALQLGVSIISEADFLNLINK